MSSRRGIALPFVLLIITLMLVGVSTVARQGLGSLTQARVEQFSKQALFAAEAGASDALRELVEDATFPGPVSEVTMEVGATYSALVFNNIGRTGGPIPASNGAEVPQGYAYILATGTMGSITRQVGVLVSPGSSTAFKIAVGVGGNARMQGSKTVAGTIKASGDIDLQGSSTIVPQGGSGRLLAGGDIESQGSTRVDEAQDVLARGSVNDQPPINGALLVEGGDTSPSTLPFINDFRPGNALNPGEKGLVLPNPDASMLTDPSANPNVINHDTQTTVTGNLDLGGQIHYFPNGVTFQGSSSITGPGTLVVSGGDMTFQGSGSYDANLVALQVPPETGFLPTIDFQGSTSVNGLVYSHGSVKVQGSFTLDGVVIAYQGNLNTQGSTRITLNSDVFADATGFEPWANGFGGEGGFTPDSGPVSVISWERM